MGLQLATFPCGLAVSLLAMAAAPSAKAAPVGPQPFTATYALKWHGITAGESTLALKQTADGTYDYSSTNRAHGLFRIAFPDPISQESMLKIENDQVMPLSYQEDNGPDRTDQNVMLQFDWSAERVRGTANGKPVDQPLAPGTQDPLSVQIELMHDLLKGGAPATFLLFDKRAAERYNYTRERTETVDTPLGRLETLVYRSDRPGSNVVTRLWLAPSLGYLPVQGERRRNNKVDFALRIRKLQRSG